MPAPPIQLVTQPSLAPTNKLSAAIVAVAFLEMSAMVVHNLFPDWYSPELWAAMKPIAVWWFAFFWRDEANA